MKVKKGFLFGSLRTAIEGEFATSNESQLTTIPLFPPIQTNLIVV